MKNKRIIKSAVCFMLSLLICFLVSGCKKENAEAPEKEAKAPEAVKASSLWDNAIYTENKTFGNGNKTIELQVKADDDSVTFTIKTDKNNLEEALLEHKLIEGEKGPYGLYVKKVNGMTADYDTDQTYWSLCQDGNPLMTGVGDTEINDGDKFQFIREK